MYLQSTNQTFEGLNFGGCLRLTQLNYTKLLLLIKLMRIDYYVRIIVGIFFLYLIFKAICNLKHYYFCLD